ncbi:MAG: hypothetical protein LBG43_04350 [Treponema sp.]|nr:hypothetical protein [Treponema sp.]
MRRNVLWVLPIMISGLFIACVSTQPLSESARLFTQETQLSLAVPMRFYTWVKVENANRVYPDIANGLLDFEYDASGDFLLKTVTHDNKIVSIWGNQILLQNEDYRQFVFSPFVVAIYALENGQEPLDIAFEALKQILADDAYKAYEKELIGVFQEGIRQYRTGGSVWANYKAEHFIVEDKTIKFK